MFFSAGGVNRNAKNYLLDRISLGEKDGDEDHLWFQIGRAVFNELFRNSKSNNKINS